MTVGEAKAVYTLLRFFLAEGRPAYSGGPATTIDDAATAVAVLAFGAWNKRGPSIAGGLSPTEVERMLDGYAQRPDATELVEHLVDILTLADAGFLGGDRAEVPRLVLDRAKHCLSRYETALRIGVGQ